jgi:hypothetical protein
MRLTFSSSAQTGPTDAFSSSASTTATSLVASILRQCDVAREVQETEFAAESAQQLR